jgi:non-ribosomal peptide synthetase component F
MIGATTNVILVRAALDPSASVRAHAARVAEAMAEPMEHAGYPLPSVLDDLAADQGHAVPMHFHGFNMIAPDNARSGFEQIMFQPSGTPHFFGELELTLLPVAAASVGHFLNDTSIAYQELDGELMFQLHARDGAFDADGAAAYLDRFVRILRTAIKNSDMSIAELSRIA